jgi:predicted ArsR family transcriptional regulator
MSREPLRVRVLDALELGPATLEQLALMLGSSHESIRAPTRQLERAELVQVVAKRPTRHGRPSNVYAIRGTMPDCHPLNAREER